MFSTIDIELAYEVGRKAMLANKIPSHINPTKEFHARCFCGYWILSQMSYDTEKNEVMKDREE